MTITIPAVDMLQPYQALVQSCISQDAAAHRELYERFSPNMMAVCYRYARNRAEAEDILQEGFIKVFQKLEKYTFKGSLEGWIRRIMVNTAIDLIRKTKQQQKETDIEEAYGEEISDDAMDNLELEYLFEIIQQLPTGYRLVFNMYAIEGFSHKEIGKELGISESTSRSQYTRARGILMKRIRKDHRDPHCEDHMESNIYKDAI